MIEFFKRARCAKIFLVILTFPTLCLATALVDDSYGSAAMNIVICSDTESFSCEEEEIIDLWPITNDQVDEDLELAKTVRHQALANISLSAINFIKNRDVLCHPILCVGTGRDERLLPFFHAFRTRVRENDVTIDISHHCNPHHICDAFDVIDLGQLYGTQIFGCVFFSHVSSAGAAVRHPRLSPSLDIYFASLIEAGFFIYSSEVYVSRDAIEMVAHHHEFKNVDGLKDCWIEKLMAVGFVNIEFIIKDESIPYGHNACSVLIVARKPPLPSPF